MEEIITQAENYFDRLEQDIDQARQSVDMEVYILSQDPVGERILQALARAASRGVRIRLLVDGAGSAMSIQTLLKVVRKAGGEAHIFHPMPWRFWQWSVAAYQGESAWQKFWHLANYINRRNHRKSCIIDEQLVWIGSMNLTQVHLPQNQGGEGWRDTMVRLETLRVDELQRAFELAWQHPPLKRQLPITPSGQFRLNYSRRLRRRAYREMLQHLGQARHRIWLTNAYFVPEQKLLRALCIAARRGVDVRLLIPGRSDVAFIPWASYHFYERLLNAGVRIFEYNTGVLHAKTAVIDHWVTVGSSNLNQRSLRHDLEVDVVLGEKQAVQCVEQHFLHDQTESIEVTSENADHYRWWQKGVGRLALLGRYWL